MIDATKCKESAWGHDHELLEKLYEAQGGNCFHCGKPVPPRGDKDMSKKGWSRDHVYPRSTTRGLARNIVIAHRGCNNRRGDMPMSDADIQRVKALYGSLGLEAFVPVSTMVWSDKIRVTLFDSVMESVVQRQDTAL
jgi:hypothetical protein